MKTIDLVFTKSKKRFAIISWLIRLYTGQPYSHVASQQEIREWGKRYFQASEGKVNYEYEDFFNKKHEIVKSYTIEVTVDLDRQIKEACYKEAGNAYGFMQNVGIILVDVASKLGFQISNPWKSGRNCSELMYKEVFVQMFGDLGYNPDIIKPHQIEEIIIKNFYFDATDKLWKRR